MANLEQILSVFNLLYSPVNFRVGILNTIFSITRFSISNLFLVIPFTF